MENDRLAEYPGNVPFSPDVKNIEIVSKIKDRVKMERLLPVDVQSILDYWYRSSRTYIESLGADPEKFPSEQEMKSSLMDRIQKAETDPTFKSPTVIICFDDHRIGFHSVTHIHTPIQGKAVFHANFWDPRFRGKGIGMVTYLKAADIFFKRFELESIQYQSPKLNQSCNRVKEKLGIKQVGEGIVDHPLARDNLPCRNYELTRLELDRLMAVWLS
jgi:hypothetical protein